MSLSRETIRKVFEKAEQFEDEQKEDEVRLDVVEYYKYEKILNTPRLTLGLKLSVQTNLNINLGKASTQS